MTSPRLRRLARGGVSAGFATFVALFAHVSSGGMLPGPMGLVAPLVLSVVACTFVSGRRLSLLRLAASVGIAQLFFHWLFVLGAGSAGSPPTHAGHSSAAIASEMVAMPARSGHLDGGAAMWIGHAIAALATVAMLFFAERLIDAVAAIGTRVGEWIARVLHPLAVSIAAAVRGSRAVIAAVATPVVSERATGASRRGPPLAV